MNDQSQDLDAFLGAKPQPAWRRYLKWGLIALGVVLLALALRSWLAGDAAPQYATQRIARGDLRVTVSATGKLAPTNQVTVGSQISGLVVRVVADVNDRVTAGQPLALIDPEQLDAQIEQGQAQLNANRAAVAQAQATLQEARATLGRFEEVSRLSGGRVPSKTELDTARAAVARAVAGVRTAEANVAAGRAQLASTQTQRARATIVSPVNGVVLARQVEPGQTVAASFNTPTLFVIAEDLSQMKLEVAVDEADVGEVKEGQAATFTVDAFPGRTFPARITRVDVGSNLSAQAASSSSSSSSGAGTTTAQVVSYAATLSVENPDMQLRPGMTATAEIVTSEKRDVLTVPNAALRYNPEAAPRGSGANSGITGALVPRGPRRGRAQGERQATLSRGAQQTVYVLGADGKPAPVRITTGNSDGSVTEVTGGDLRPGMTVITGQLASEEGGSTRRGGAGGGQRQGGGAGGGGAGGGGQRGQ